MIGALNTPIIVNKIEQKILIGNMRDSNWLKNESNYIKPNDLASAQNILSKHRSNPLFASNDTQKDKPLSANAEPTRLLSETNRIYDKVETCNHHQEPK